MLSLVAVLKRVFLKIGRSDGLLPDFLVPLGGLVVTVSKWFGCLFFVGLAWDIVLPACIITSAAARRSTCSWPLGVPSSDSCETMLETRFGRRNAEARN